jgi:hypothetical protein
MIAVTGISGDRENKNSAWPPWKSIAGSQKIEFWLGLNYRLDW